MPLSIRSSERTTHICICIAMQNSTILSTLGRGEPSRYPSQKKTLLSSLIALEGPLDPRTFSEVRGFFSSVFGPFARRPCMILVTLA